MWQGCQVKVTLIEGNYFLPPLILLSIFPQYKLRNSPPLPSHESSGNPAFWSASLPSDIVCCRTSVSSWSRSQRCPFLQTGGWPVVKIEQILPQAITDCVSINHVLLPHVLNKKCLKEGRRPRKEWEHLPWVCYIFKSHQHCTSKLCIEWWNNLAKMDEVKALLLLENIRVVSLQFTASVKVKTCFQSCCLRIRIVVSSIFSSPSLSSSSPSSPFWSRSCQTRPRTDSCTTQGCRLLHRSLRKVAHSCMGFTLHSNNALFYKVMHVN